jgi:hydrogenase expression/formation protein HypE
MKSKESNILLGHGSGGTLMHELIDSVFVKHFGNEILNEQTDSAIVPAGAGEIAFTTDSFVIDPLFFPGGDIGKLAVCGTVNDLAVAGAEPLYISVSFIIEEGFAFRDLEKITESLAAEAKKAGVMIVTGDTKVVNRGKCDKLFINTSGIGRISADRLQITKAKGIVTGDRILINGMIGDHGIAVMNARESLNFSTQIESDCASLNHLINEILSIPGVKFMRDPTRGGIATVLNELAVKTGKGVEIAEPSLPVRSAVRAMCEILGFDPLHVANEGKVVIVASENSADEILKIMRNNALGKNASVIGTIVDSQPGKVILHNETGGRRFVDPLTGDQLPRIC